MNWYERAHALHSAGQWKEAEPLYQKAIQERPDHEDALFWLAMLYTNLDRPLEAIDLFYRALDLNPNESGTHAGLGIALYKMGQAEEAEACFRRALELEPDTPELYFHLSSAQFGQGRLEEALMNCEKAIALKPDFVEAHHNRSEILRRLGRAEEATEATRKEKALSSLALPASANKSATERPRAQSKSPSPAASSVSAHYNRGLKLLRTRRRNEAVAAFHQALTADPEFVPAHNAVSAAAIEQGAWEEAERHLDCALALEETNVEAWCHLGHLRLAQTRYAEAEAAYRRALALQPHSAELHTFLSGALSAMGRYAESEVSARAALMHDPRHAMAHNNLSSALFMQNRYEEALRHSLRAVEIHATPLFLCGLGHVQTHLSDFAGAEASYRRAISLQPHYARAHAGLGGVYLLNGDFARGWPEYAYVRRTPEVEPRTFTQPEWDGSPLPDGTLLVYATQGFGDMIQFVRYMPLVKARAGGTVILECYPELLTLFQDIPGVDRVVAKVPGSGPPAIDFDTQTSVMDLPRLFQTELATIPGAVPYLGVNEEKRQQWQERLREETRFKVGIVWAGRPEHSNDHNRSCRLAEFAPLAEIPGVALFSLQKGEAAQQVSAVPSTWSLRDLAPDLQDFTDTAAALANLDLVIGVDTVVAHLAGALARPVWTLLPHVPDWRWMRERTDSPWYPTLCLFRQPAPGDWAPLFQEVAGALMKKIR